MPRRLLSWLLVWLALVVPALAQSNGSLLGLNIGAPLAQGGGSTYVGPGDIVSGATAWYGLRAYNAAYAATPGKSVNVRRASDNVACDVNVATTGGLGLTTATCNSSTQGGITPSAFAGTDATATCTLASTTATCASASSTPHVGSTVVGASLTQPCLITAVGTFTGGAGTFTTSLAGTSTSCGTISVGETFTMTYGLFVTEAYDQTAGNACGSASCDTVQSTAGSQPQLLPVCFNSGTLPCIHLPTSTTMASAHNFTPNASATASYTTVGQVVTALGTPVWISENGGNSVTPHNSGQSFTLVGGTSGNIRPTSALGVVHAANAVANGASSVINIDGTETTGTVVNSTTAGAPVFSTGAGAIESSEGGFWDNTTFSGSQRTDQCHNARIYYGTTGSC